MAAFLSSIALLDRGSARGLKIWVNRNYGTQMYMMWAWETNKFNRRNSVNVHLWYYILVGNDLRLNISYLLLLALGFIIGFWTGLTTLALLTATALTQLIVFSTFSLALSLPDLRGVEVLRRAMPGVSGSSFPLLRFVGGGLAPTTPGGGSFKLTSLNSPVCFGQCNRMLVCI